MTQEVKNKNFKRLAEKRVNIILDRIRILGNLSNTALYNYSDPEVKKMFETIEEALKVERASFRRGEKETKQKFTFE